MNWVSDIVSFGFYGRKYRRHCPSGLSEWIRCLLFLALVMGMAAWVIIANMEASLQLRIASAVIGAMVGFAGIYLGVQFAIGLRIRKGWFSKLSKAALRFLFPVVYGLLFALALVDYGSGERQPLDDESILRTLYFSVGLFIIVSIPLSLMLFLRR